MEYLKNRLDTLAKIEKLIEISISMYEKSSELCDKSQKLMKQQVADIERYSKQRGEIIQELQDHYESKKG